MTNESIWEKVDSIEKRFENRLDKSNVKFNTLNPVWDSEKETALNVFEMIDELNYLNDCCNNLIDDNTEYVAEINQMHKENEQLKQSIKEIDEAELHLKQIILKRINDYIWEWEDEGTPVAQVLRELQDEIKGDVE